MTCHRINIGGFTTIVCQRGVRPKLCACGAPATLQCDWKVGKKKNDQPKTCDRYICKQHALEVALEKHLCVEHQASYKQWQEERNGAAGGS